MRVLVAIAAVLLISSPASAQDDEQPAAGVADPCLELEAEARAAPEPVDMERVGGRGVWFPMAQVRHLLCIQRNRASWIRSVRLADTELDLWRYRVENLREAYGLAVEARTILGDVVEAASRRAREAEDRADSVLRSPLLWFGTGIVATVAVILGARYLL